MKYVKVILEVLVAIVGLWSGGITIADKYGVQLNGFALWTAENSWWLFPAALLFLGLAIGWSAHKRMVDVELLKEAQREAEKQKAETERERIRAEEAKAERIHKTKQEEAERARKLEEEKKKRADWLIKYFKNLKFMEKVLLYSIYLKGSHDLPNEGYSDLDAEDLISFVDTEVLEDGTRLTLKDDVKKIFDVHPETLEVVKEYCDREFGSMMP